MKKSVVLLWDGTDKTLSKFKKWLPKATVATDSRECNFLHQRLFINDELLNIGDEILINDDQTTRKIKRTKNCKGMM